MRFILIVLSLMFFSQTVEAQSLADDEENCGAVGYACQFGRECIDYRCEPAWIQIEESGAPEARGGHQAAMLDGYFVVIGGCSSLTSGHPAEVTTGVYDPVENGWWNGPDLPSARVHFSAVPSPDGIYAYGGVTKCWDGTAVGPSLGLLDSVSGSWTDVVWAGEPTARYNAGFVWTGDSLLVYGGSSPLSSSCNSGGEFFPGVGWVSASCSLNGSSRAGPFEMFVDSGSVRAWGGGAFGSMTDGLEYDLTTGSWADWSIPVGTPDVSTLTASMGAPRSVWTDDFAYYLRPDGTITIHDRLAGTWEDDYVEAPSGLCGEAAVAWTGTELVAWSGYCDGQFSTTGGRYQPPAP